MLIDLTLKVSPRMISDAQGNEIKSFDGHIGTHFDVMNKEFPLEFTRRKAVVFDVSKVIDRDITVDDINLDRVEPNMFITFATGFIEKLGYGGPEYFKDHPQLSHELIESLLDKGISMIGIDFAGVRRGAEHTPKDQYCADRGVFVIENLVNLHQVLEVGDGSFIAHIYPLNFADMTGLPCRVVAEVF